MLLLPAASRSCWHWIFIFSLMPQSSAFSGWIHLLDCKIVRWILWKFHTLDLTIFTLAPSRCNTTSHTQFHIFLFFNNSSTPLTAAVYSWMCASAGACHLPGTTALRKTNHSSFRSQSQCSVRGGDSAISSRPVWACCLACLVQQAQRLHEFPSTEVLSCSEVSVLLRSALT